MPQDNFQAWMQEYGPDNFNMRVVNSSDGENDDTEIKDDTAIGHKSEKLEDDEEIEKTE